MNRPKTHARAKGGVVAILLGGAIVGPVGAQSTAPLVTDPGTTLTVTLELTAYGFTGSDTDTASTTGTALLTLFPTDPPFTHAILHSLHIEVEELNFHDTLGPFQVDATLTDLVLERVGPAFGTITGAGDASFPAATARTTGTMYVSISFVGSWVFELDGATVETLDAHITEDGGIVILDGIVFPDVQVESEEVVVTASVDQSNLRLSGAYSSALLGDGDADGDLDLNDCVFPASMRERIGAG
jgi:hypothetical protein